MGGKDTVMSAGVHLESRGCWGGERGEERGEERRGERRGAARRAGGEGREGKRKDRGERMLGG